MRDRRTRQRPGWSTAGSKTRSKRQHFSGIFYCLPSNFKQENSQNCGFRSPAACVGCQKGLESGLSHANIRQEGGGGAGAGVGEWGHGRTTFSDSQLLVFFLNCKVFLVCLKVKPRVTSDLVRHESQQEASLSLASCIFSLGSLPFQKYPHFISNVEDRKAQAHFQVVDILEQPFTRRKESWNQQG